jgi:hypothetical protein
MPFALRPILATDDPLSNCPGSDKRCRHYYTEQGALTSQGRFDVRAMSYHKKNSNPVRRGFVFDAESDSSDKMRLRRLPRRRHSGLLRSSSARSVPIFVEMESIFWVKAMPVTLDANS